MTYDLAILGGGPAGYVAAEKAAKAGFSTVLFEKNSLGGVCLGEGCIPTKALLYCAKMYEHAKDSARFGVTSPDASFDFAKMMERKTRTVRRLVGGIKAKMRAAGVEVVEGEASLSRSLPSSITLSCNGQEYTAARLLVCTGSSCVVPPIPGLDPTGGKIVTNREILSLDNRPDELVIIGGGVIGMEFASLFNTLGTKVTVIEMLPKILGPLDSEISGMLQKQYEKKGVVFHLGCKVTAIENDTVVFQDPEKGECRVQGDKILLSVGRRANLTGYGLENTGVRTSRGIEVDDRMRTSVPGIWAAGDVTGFSMLAHTASREAVVAVNDMLGIDDHMSYDAIPGIVYTNPEVAGIGITGDNAPDDVEVRKLSMNFSGRYMAENDCDGMCKVLCSKSDGRILGVQMIGNPCSELAFGACMAIEKGMTAADFEKIVFPHPTVAEILKETVISGH